MTLCLGMYVVLAIQIFRNHARKPIKRMQRAHRLMLLYSVVMLCLVCVWYAVGTAFSEYVDVEVPFQPDLARALTSCQPMAITRTLSHTLMTWLSDGLLVSKFHSGIASFSREVFRFGEHT
jgi:hypothetical protein